MQLIMSINNKFYEKTPLELVALTKKYATNIAGFEISADFFNEADQKYLYDLAYVCNKENLILQIHANSEYPIEQQKEFFKLCDELATIVNYKIKLVYHPLYNADKEESIKETSIYFSQMKDIIETNNHQVIISIENLNDDHNLDRLNKEDLIPIVDNNENLYFTYDLGHEIADYGKITDLDSVLASRLINVHFHSFAYEDSHQVIYDNDEHKNALIKCILYLKEINYDNTIVFEYDFYTLKGYTFEEKIKEYISSMEYIGEYF